jgi:anti-sigma B factor antagonist
MNLEVEQIKNDAVIRASGRLDMNTSPALRRAALRLYTNSGCKNLMVDLTEVSFIDTSALATLIEILVAAKEQCAQLTLCGLNENVRYLIDVNGLTGFFRIESSTREELRV